MGRKPDLAARAKILQEAEHLIHLRGYRSTSLDDIAKSCRMTKANLLHHYGSKEDLGLAVLDAKMSDYKKRRCEPLCAENDPARAVTRMFEETSRFYDGNGCRAGCFVANIALEMSDSSEAFRKRASLFFEEWARSMAQCLSRAKSSGYFQASLDPKASAEAIISLYEGAILLARTRRDASVFLRVGKMARSMLEQHRSRPRRIHIMGPKTPCGC